MKKLSGREIRSKFFSFFEERSHRVVSSSSLVPQNDPTLLFANAGMNQFKDFFIGAENLEYFRAVTSQKCLRISGKHNDLENVGVTARHHTFFEMLGNFSFGDYFKSDAISYAWSFITEELKLDKKRLWITIFREDDEAEELWQKVAGVSKDRILRCDEEDNFWSMGDVGPCGPCSEMHYYLGDDLENQSEADFRKDDGTYVEIWNLVFMQFEKRADGTMTPLPKPSIDTGMGLERITAVVQGFRSNYDCDLLRPLITAIEKLSGHKYLGKSYEVKDLKTDKQYESDVAMRVIADHIRSISFLIGDGVMPSSDGRGYVLRRVLRRAIRHGRALGFNEPFLTKLVGEVEKLFGEQYPELSEKRAFIEQVVKSEEEKFNETLDSGLQTLKREVEKLKTNEVLSGEVAFQLHDTFGFPVDLTADVLKAYKRNVDLDGFEKCMKAQKDRSREDRKSRNIVFSGSGPSVAKTNFLGYEESEVEGSLLHSEVDKENDLTVLAFDATPFYGESGGQVGDTGSICLEGIELEVVDTQKTPNGVFLHFCEGANPELAKLVGKKAKLSIDNERRKRIRLNHSATHIVHAALRKFLGEHVKQAGSRVDDRSLRFDYSHFETVNHELLNEMINWANEELRSNYEVVTRIMDLEAAKASGATALFGEKYGSKVRVVEIGANSIELCGGSHASRSGDIGSLLVVSEASIAAGVRRIECVSGASALQKVQELEQERRDLLSHFPGDGKGLSDRIYKAIERTKQLESSLEELRSKLVHSTSRSISEQVIKSSSGINVVAQKLESADTDTLKGIVDDIRVRLGSGVVALFGESEGKGILVAGATSDLKGKVHVGNLVKAAVETVGGRGGGRPDFAQAGGLDSSQSSVVLKRFVELVP